MYLGHSSVLKTHLLFFFSWSAMPSSSWLRSASGHTTSTCLRTRTRSRASVRRLLFPTWSSEVSQSLISPADLVFPAVMLTVSVQVRMRRPLRITRRNTSAGTWKDLVEFSLISQVVEGRPLLSDLGHHFPSPVLPQISTPVEGQRATW